MGLRGTGLPPRPLDLPFLAGWAAILGDIAAGGRDLLPPSAGALASLGVVAGRHMDGWAYWISDWVNPVSRPFFPVVPAPEGLTSAPLHGPELDALQVASAPPLMQEVRDFASTHAGRLPRETHTPGEEIERNLAHKMRRAISNRKLTPEEVAELMELKAKSYGPLHELEAPDPLENQLEQ